MIDQGALAAGVGGPAVGQQVTSPWFPGSWPITQGWGPSDYSGEPEGHGYAHWHAGVDVGMDCGTELELPHNLLGDARWVDNPGGYGTALRLELYTLSPAGKGLTRQRTFDVWLGHLRQRIVADGEGLSGGEKLAASNNTGNSTGCHLHFEVRPAGGKYGTDVDPTSLLMLGQPYVPPDGTTSSDGNPYNVLDPRHAEWELQHSISAGITSAETALLGLGQAALGTTLLAGGLAIVAFGLRGKNLSQFRSSVGATFTRASQATARRRAPAAPATPAGATEATTPSARRQEARVSRVRVTHQRELLRQQPPLSPEAEAAVHAARSTKGRRLSPEVRAELNRRRDFKLSRAS